ncbi:major facilitator superfamily domain-containing protein [Gongronella butleri]|nr:major facilitator superfamily domain-containing protein [Gongronella butleri]
MAEVRERRPPMVSQGTSDTMIAAGGSNDRIDSVAPLDTLKIKEESDLMLQEEDLADGGSTDDASTASDADSDETVAVTPMEALQVDEEGITNEFSVVPVDGASIDCWVCILCGFVLEMMTYGLPFSYSAFQTFYKTQPEFESATTTQLALVGTLTTALTYMGGSVTGILGRRFHLKTLMYVGNLLMIVGFVGASFATNVTHLLICQGVFLGLGGGILYFSFYPFIFMFWRKHIGTASGVISMGTGFGGILFPIVCEHALASIGFRWLLRVLAACTVVLCLGPILILRPREYTKPQRFSLSLADFKFMTNRKFIVLAICLALQSFSYFIPALFVSSYALSVGLSEQMSTTLLSVMNGVTMVGMVLLGFLSDKLGYWRACIISSTIASLSTFLLWGFAGNSTAMLMIYVILYGIFGAGFASCFPSMTSDISTDHHQYVLISGMFMLIRGIANLVGNPLGSLFLSSADGWHDITYFVGSFLMASAVAAGTIPLIK